jgi:predicted dehydrogenase
MWRFETVTEPLGVGVIGCGNVSAYFHLPAYLARPDRARVVAASDPSLDRVREVGSLAQLPVDRMFQDAKGLLALPEVHFIDICAPPRFHAEIAIAAAKAGKHILCEKPITTVPAEATLMLAAAASAGVRVGIMHNYLFFPELAAAHRIIASGEIGDVRLAIVNYLGVPDLPGIEGTAQSWRHDPASSGGGVLIDMLHALYVAEDLIGRRTHRVSAYVSGNANHPRVEAQALCRLETDGPTALVNVGWGVGPGGVFVEGTQGSLEIAYQRGGTNPFTPFESLVVKTAAGSRHHPIAPGPDLVPLVIEGIGGVIDDFVTAIRADHSPVASGDDGLHALELTLAAYESAALGRTVAVPLDRTDPLFLRGARAVHELDLPAWSPVGRQGLFRANPPS